MSRLPLVLVGLLLTGCLGGEPPASDAPASQPPTGPPSAMDGPDTFVNGSMPDLPVGRAWTYAAKQLYSPDPEFTIVVASAGPEGYHFAGGAEDDLVYEALWNSEWHGPHKRDLSAADQDWATLFAWPLADGKTWAYMDSIKVTARAADVQTPMGTEPGYVIEGSNERMRVRYEYAPSVGYLASFLTEIDGKVFEDLKLVRMTDSPTQPWVWFELGPLAVAGNPHEPAAFELAAGWDHVLVSAGGRDGGRAAVANVGGDAWRDEFAGEESWHHAMLPAKEGRWVASVQGRPFLDGAPPSPVPSPMGWAYAHAAPVKWVRGP